MTRRIINFGRARYAFVEIEVRGVVRTAYAPARPPIDWRRLERMAVRARVEAQ